jgi:hypothetical protein
LWIGTLSVRNFVIRNFVIRNFVCCHKEFCICTQNGNILRLLFDNNLD